MPVVRVSILRCQPSQFSTFKRLMAESNRELEAGIRQMHGLVHYYAGHDEATLSLTNISVWQALSDAKQMDTFEPMLALGRSFAAKGATFERPIMNYATLWEISPRGLSGSD